MPPRLSGKLRIRATNLEGQPLPDLSVELVPPPTSGAKEDKKSKGDKGDRGLRRDRGTDAGQPILGALSTSRDGFVIFSLDAPAIQSSGSADIWVRFGQNDELIFPLRAEIAAAGSKFVNFPLDVDALEHLVTIKGHWLDDGLEADDIWAIPQTFPDLGPLEFGDDRCGRLIPNDQTVRVSLHNHVVRTRKDAMTCLKVTGEGDGHDGVGVASTGQGSREVRLHEGELISYEFKSTRLGYTYGDLLYSLPLAPCESVTLAVSQWEQRQVARAEQQSTSQESSNSSYQRQNTLSEALNAVSSSSNKAWAVMTGNSSGGTGSGSGKVGVWSLSGAAAMQATVGASASGSYNRANFASSASRSFSDRIQASAEALRRDHQVVIMEQSETENQAISYRTVCNNNHCHVLNIFYHEVLTNYRLSTRILGHREVYFVPYVVKDFTIESALCARSTVIPFLLDERIRDCYERLSPGASTSGPANMVSEFKIDVQVLDAWGVGSGNLTLFVQTKSGQTYTFPVPAAGFWQTGQSYSYTVQTPAFDLEDLHEVGLSKHFGSPLGSDRLRLGSLSFFGRSEGDSTWTPLASASSIPPSIGWFDVRSPVDVQPAVKPDAATDAGCAAAVLAHLNCNAHYYNSLLWLLEDPNERICRFDKIVCGQTGNTLADLVLPEPVAVMGCYVAFAKANSTFVPYTGPQVPNERLLTLPTPGIFADAALGQCSACEKVDDDVYWNWKDSPCACGGKDVKLRDPTDTPLISPGVSVFPTLPTTAWATAVTPPTGEGAATNSLVAAFGSELAKALASGADSTAQLTQLQLLLNKLTETVGDIMPESGSSGGSGGSGGSGSEDPE